MTTEITKLLGIQYPIIGAPMFLVSTPPLVAAVSNNGGIGTFASMSHRTLDDLRTAIHNVRELTGKPFGINLVLHKAHNPLIHEQFQLCIEENVPLLITSMGTPRSMIQIAHDRGIKVFCDIVHEKQARIVAKAGADAVICVAQGAGGHAGRISPFALVPQIRDAVDIPVIAAGSISTGRQMAAAFSLGASAVYIGTRFIATPEAGAAEEYKQALIDADPDDIIYSDAISGVNANWLRVSFERWQRYKAEETHSAKLRNWIDFWSAGHGVAQIHDIRPVAQIMQEMLEEYRQVKSALP